MKFSNRDRFSVDIYDRIRVATGAGEPVEEDRSGWKIVQEELQPYAAADLGFLHEGQRPYASADHISPPCWAGVIPQDPTREQDLTPDSPWPRNPKSRNKSYLARKGRGEEGPRGLSEDTDGVIDQRRKRGSEDLPPAHSSLFHLHSFYILLSIAW
ncbi:hypothetical protein GEV33_006290 [Tenebrio molitor]|uniref:Uncharacterized protein n=1 Tax=Tenebrio molitor TaxID=7067 RepID=A0A8J6LK82_TENMO|nr:hypothetical protein GEV33_006290 [Tenebrio molitor]